MAGEITIDLRNGRRVRFDEVVLLERKNGTWLRCVRNERSPRENFPETTTYYRLARDVERIVVGPDGESGGASASDCTVPCDGGTDATAIPTDADGEVYPNCVDRRVPE